MKLSFRNLFRRKPAAKPVARKEYPPAREVRERRGDIVLTLDDYRPPRLRMAAPVTAFDGPAANNNAVKPVTVVREIVPVEVVPVEAPAVPVDWPVGIASPTEVR